MYLTNSIYQISKKGHKVKDLVHEEKMMISKERVQAGVTAR